MQYDANGNILSMSQRGLQVSSIALIDSLNYQYFANSNRLQKVGDLSTGGGFMGDFKDSSSAANDYTYDENGNINSDNNRKMYGPGSTPGAVFNILDKADSIVIAGKATTYYYYDAGGAMLAKKVNTYTSSPTVVKNYQYLGGFVYLNDTLQYSLIEGGRIRYAKKKNSTTGATFYAYEYDYFISDHMGNVRTVVTEGRDTSTYKATMEAANQTVEDALFANEYTPVNTIVNKPSGFDTDGANAKVAKVNGSGQKVGPSLVLKVMAGDKVQLSTYAFYNTATQPPVGGVNLLSDILSVLAGGVVNNSPGKLNSTNTAAVNTALSPNVTNFLNNSRSYDNTRPKAYLNWILFDNQFNFVSSNSGVMQVQSGASKQALIPALQTMAKNGYLYVYVSNESGQDVFFDDITIKHTTGPLMQEQAYYPYGLEIQGLSDKAMMKAPTNYKYNGGSELEDEDGVGYYNTFYRKYDAQIGRFTGVDILADQFAGITPYQFGGNNPISLNDPSGAKTTNPTNPASFKTATDLINYITQHGISGFGNEFQWYVFYNAGGDNNNLAYVAYGDKFERTKDGKGFRLNFSGEKINGGFEKDSDTRTTQRLNEVVVGSLFVPNQALWTSALQYGETNRDASYKFLSQTQHYDVMWDHNYSIFLDRKNAGASMQNSTDRKSYQENFTSMQHYYQAMQDGKVMQGVAVAAIFAPFALEVLPVVGSAGSSSTELAGLEFYETQALKSMYGTSGKLMSQVFSENLALKATQAIGLTSAGLQGYREIAVRILERYNTIQLQPGNKAPLEQMARILKITEMLGF